MIVRASLIWRMRTTVFAGRISRRQNSAFAVSTGASHVDPNTGSSDEHQRIAPVWTGIVTTPPGYHGSIDELITSVNAGLLSKKAGVLHSHQADIAILVTPTFARHAQDPALPLKLLRNILGSDRTYHQSLDAITAVVDRLPSSHGSAEGHEGLAYAISLQPSLLGGSSSRVPMQMSAQKPGSLYFHLQSLPSDSHSSAAKVDMKLQLPLAQTIFSTGLASTLVHTTYRLDEASETMEPIKQEHLESQILTLPIGSKDVNFHAPLLPLTAASRINHCMGNIVRTVSVGTDHTAKTQPASQELEAAISAYFKTQEISPRPVTVWALIVPEVLSAGILSDSNEGITSLLGLTSSKVAAQWRPDADIFEFSTLFNSQIGNHLARGARLCKVLSGGGGWGKKAGLLSLDPDHEYSTRELRGEQGWDFRFSEKEEMDPEEQKRKAIGQNFQEGETIMFFLATDYPRHDACGTSATGLGETPIASAMFGSLPSSIDEMPSEVSFSESEDTPVPQYEGYVFGMLSEGGMAITFDSGISGRDSTSHTVLRSKFDVPHSMITIGNIHVDDHSNRYANVDKSPVQKVPSTEGGSEKKTSSGSLHGMRAELEFNRSWLQSGILHDHLRSNYRVSDRSLDFSIGKVVLNEFVERRARVQLLLELWDKDPSRRSSAIKAHDIPANIRRVTGQTKSQVRKIYRTKYAEAHVQRIKNIVDADDAAASADDKATKWITETNICLQRVEKAVRRLLGEEESKWLLERTPPKVLRITKTFPSTPPHQTARVRKVVSQTYPNIRRVRLATETAYRPPLHEKFEEQRLRSVAQASWESKRSSSDLWDLMQDKQERANDTGEHSQSRHKTITRRRGEHIIRTMDHFTRV